jgi:hypothetical protein
VRVAVATSIIFVLAGIKSEKKIARFIDELALSTEPGDAEFGVKHQALLCFLLWIALMLIRGFVVLVLSPFLKQIGENRRTPLAGFNCTVYLTRFLGGGGVRLRTDLEGTRMPQSMHLLHVSWEPMCTTVLLYMAQYWTNTN